MKLLWIVSSPGSKTKTGMRVNGTLEIVQTTYRNVKSQI